VGKTEMSISGMKKILKENFISLFKLDLRALACMRICIALCLIIDLVIRISDLNSHYTNEGTLPLEALFRHAWPYFNFSIYTISGSSELLIIIFLVNFFCMLCLLIGYRTKLFTILCWVFLLSLHNRNPFILQAGDDLLRLTLFWAIFLPWGYCYSIDSLKIAKLKYQKYSYQSLAGFVYILQITIMYFFSALLKDTPEWNSDFTALYYALSLDQILMPAGKLIYPYQSLLTYLTVTVYYLELLFPFLLLIPFRTRALRIIFFIAMALFHAGIMLCLNVGLFPLISVTCMIALIPEHVIDKISRYKFSEQMQLAGNKIRLFFAFHRTYFFPKENFFSSSFMIFLFVFAFIWNLQTTMQSPEYLSIDSSNWIIRVFRIDQHWGMFAPSVFKDDGWFILEGKTNDGQNINIQEKGSKINYDKPEYVAGMFKNDRWRKYSENILMVHYAFLRPYYCSYLMKKWNLEHPDIQIKKLNIIYMKERSLPDYKTEPIKKEMLCDCAL
jgi:hypothetical protein